MPPKYYSSDTDLYENETLNCFMRISEIENNISNEQEKRQFKYLNRVK